MSEVMIVGSSSSSSWVSEDKQGEGEGEREAVSSRFMELVVGMLGMRAVGLVVCGLGDVVVCCWVEAVGIVVGGRESMVVFGRLVVEVVVFFFVARPRSYWMGVLFESCCA